MNKTSPIEGRAVRILLVDDHAVVRAGYRHFLATQAALSVVGEAEHAGQAYRMALQLRPDVVVVDISLPGASGLALVARLAQRLPEVRSLVCSMHETPMLVQRALAQGAMGYVSKRASPQCLMEAITALAAGCTYVHLGDAPAAAQPPEAVDPLVTLSPREFEVFRLMVEGRRTAEIARDLQLSGKTVANYGATIRFKLGMPTAAALVRLGMACGLLPHARPER